MKHPQMHWTFAVIGGGLATMLLDAMQFVPSATDKELAFVGLVLAIKWWLR